MEESIYTLQQLLSQVKGALDDAFPLSVWVKAEIQSLSVNRSGHCYIDLIEKNMLTGALLAQARAIIWSSRYKSLAVRFSVNKNYLSSRFHKEVGITITDYINQVRIQRAANLLRSSSLSVQQVAEQCGFADGNYFTRIFKKINGMSPNEYRKLMKSPIRTDPVLKSP